MQGASQFTWKLLAMALALAMLAAGMVPAVVFSLGYGIQASALATKAQIEGRHISLMIAESPQGWMSEGGGLEALLARDLGTINREHARIVAMDGTVLATAGVEPALPSIERAVPLSDAGRLVGRLIVARSLRTLIMDTVRAAGLGLLLGGVIFLAAWRVPIRAVRHGARALRAETERLATTLGSIADAVVTTDTAGCVRSLNPAAERLLEWTLADAGGRPVDQVLRLEEEHAGASRTVSVSTLERRKGFGGVCCLVTRSGGRIPVQLSTAPIQSGSESPLGNVVVLHDVSEIRRLTSQLEWQVSHDPLTELANRRAFGEKVFLALEGARRRGERHVLFFMDLDQFKVVNDTCGHSAGDQLLRQVAGLMRSKVRRSDCLARLGGDEFGLLLTDCSAEKAEAIADELLRAIADARFVWGDKLFSIGVSIGLADVSPLFDDTEALMKAVDSACYAAKHKGKGRVQRYQPDDAATMATNLQVAWVSRITRALDDGRFTLVFQRYMALGEDDGCQHGEVLLRMIDEDGRIIPPNTFIPAAERFNLMSRLDRWVIAEAFAQYRRLPGSSRQVWSINLSGQSLSRDDLADCILALAEEHGVPPTGICFEVTETAAINNLAQASGHIKILRDRGFTFALDDFGVGVCSFLYLKTLPIDWLKIDGSFVRDLLRDGMSRAMVCASQDISRTLGLRTVAEFVDSEATLAELRRIGIDFAQGYAIAEPIPLIAHVNHQQAVQAVDLRLCS